MEGGRRFQLVRFFCCFSFSIQISHSCFSSVATVAHVLDGLRRGRATAMHPLDEVVARLGGGGKAADEAAAGTFLTAPERATAGSCLVSCWFCLFRFYAAALTPSPCPPRFQAVAAAAGVVGRGRAVRQGSAEVRLPQPGVGSKIFLYIAVLFCYDASLTPYPCTSLPTASCQRSSSRRHWSLVCRP